MSGTMVPSRGGDDAARLATGQAAVADASAVSSTLPGVGQQLKSARLAKGLSTNDVAKALKLSLRQVVALEADDWPSLPCNTIIRGFVRNYGRLLGLDSDLLMVELDRLTLPQGAELEMSVGTPVNLPAEGRIDRRDMLRVLSGLIVLLVAVAAYFFFPQELWLQAVSRLKSMAQSAVVKPASVDNVRASDADPVKAPAPPAAASDAAAEVATDAAAEAATAAAPAVPASAGATGATGATSVAPALAPTAPAVAGATQLKFAFDQASWVEVRDRSGKIIFSKKNEAGTEQDVEGQPPFAVVVGNAGHVTLRYKGQPVDLSQRSKGDVARLTIE